MASFMQQAGVVLVAFAASAAFAQPAVPSNVAVRDAGAGAAVITWTNVSGPTTIFEIDRAPVFTSTPTIAAGATSYRDECGNGTFTYRVRARNASGVSGYSSTASVTVTSANAGTPPVTGGTSAEGWSIPVRSADTKVYYVSSSGSDNNSGLTEDAPFRTIAAAYAKLRHGSPDWMLLKRGDTFNESLGHWRKNGRSPAEPMVVATYGNDVRRPVLRTPTVNGTVESAFRRSGGGGSPVSVENVWVLGLELTPNSARAAGDWCAGIEWHGAGANCLFEDLYIHGFHNNVLVEGEGVGAQGIKVRRCLIVDAYGTHGHSQGVYAFNVRDFTLEENLIDHNGWSRDTSAPPTVFNHNIYLHGYVYNTTIRGNVITYASSHGVSMNMDGLVEENYISQNAISSFVRTAPVVYRRNVVIDPRDLSTTEPRGSGLIVGDVFTDIPPPLPAPGPALIEENIFAHSRTRGEGSAIELTSNRSPNSAAYTVRRNIVYNWGGNYVTILTPFTDTMAFEDNTLILPSGSPCFPLVENRPNPLNRNIFTFQRNHYFSTCANQWFRIGEGRNIPNSQWITAAGESGSTYTNISFVDPNRTAGTYNATLGGAATLEGFLNEMKTQSRFRYRQPYTGKALTEYVRAGFAPQ